MLTPHPGRDNHGPLPEGHPGHPGTGPHRPLPGAPVIGGKGRRRAKRPAPLPGVPRRVRISALRSGSVAARYHPLQDQAGFRPCCSSPTPGRDRPVAAMNGAAQNDADFLRKLVYCPRILQMAVSGGDRSAKCRGCYVLHSLRHGRRV